MSILLPYAFQHISPQEESSSVGVKSVCVQSILQAVLEGVEHLVVVSDRLSDLEQISGLSRYLNQDNIQSSGAISPDLIRLWTNHQYCAEKLERVAKYWKGNYIHDKDWSAFMEDLSSLSIANNLRAQIALIPRTKAAPTAEEYTANLKLIEDLQHCYDRQMEIVDYQNPFQLEVFQGDIRSAKLDVYSLLDRYLQHCSKLRSKTERFFTDLRSNLIQDYRAQCDRVQLLIEELRLSQSLGSYMELSSEQLADIRHLGIASTELGLGGEIQIEALQEQVMQLRESLDLRVLSYLKRINIRNFDNSELRELELEIDQFYQRLSEEKLLKKNLQSNEISSWKKYQELINVHVHLEATKRFLESNDAYFKWKSLIIHADDTLVDFIDNIRAYPASQWKDAYKLWMYYSTVPAEDQAIMHDFSNLCSEYWDRLDKIESQWQELAQMLCGRSQTLKIEHLSSIQFDQIRISDRARYLVLEPLSDVHRTTNISFVFNAAQALPHVHFVNAPLYTFELSKQLFFARLFAQVLLEANLEYLFYVSANYSIIIQAGIQDVPYFLESKYKEPFKELTIVHDVEDRLVEFLIHDSSTQVFIIDQAFFGSGKWSLTRQMQLLKLLEQIDFEICYYENHKLLIQVDYNRYFLNPQE